ncbi:Protein MIZU-KUSSEI 1-like [Theobroma cacao]|uniref:Protein MIZU-KUSSEI 1 n=2 Tax=Theobroma cacao TaxID=3641 RepID=A0AB32V507_THECC|nr:PREDICTED: protein MIZU-KUSSEI 1 [Theobroma cacao]EOY09181.1 Acetoin:2,6-dichlorophenolindophenol oxidoreductase subunit beta [Theobroma cacao]WRX25163.1 Protein MIZU-KUSSEI 1-like [Theobroma cacao]
MKHHQELATLQRSTSYNNFNYKSTRNKINPSNFPRSTSLPIPEHEEISDKLLIPRTSSSPRSSIQRFHNVNSRFSSLLRSLLKIIAFPNIIPTTCKWLTLPTHLSITPSLGRKVTGTLFGLRRGHVSFAVQDDPRSEPVLLLELAMSTSSLVKEMSSGLVRIALECEKVPGRTAAQPCRTGKLFHEPMWTMYCNGRKSGYAVTRTCTESDWHVLSTVQSVSVGAGVIPVVEDARKGGGSEGELLYMRAKFERVVGSRDSEAFYMMNPDNNGGPELSIFLLRI